MVMAKGRRVAARASHCRLSASVVVRGCLIGLIGLIGPLGLSGLPAAAARPVEARQAPAVKQIKRTRQGRQRLESIGRDLNRVRQQRQRVQGRERAVLTDLEVLDKALTERRRQLTGLSQALRQAEEEMRRIEQEEQTLEARVAELRGALRQRAMALYQANRPVPLVLLVDARDPYDAVVRQGRIRRIAQREADLVGDLTQSLLLLEARRRQLTQLRQGLSDRQQAVAEASISAETERKKKSLLLAAIRRERALYEQTAGELEHAASRLRTIMRQSALQESGESGPSPVPQARPPKPGQGMGQRGRFVLEKGRLSWPHEGAVAAAFGRQWHPRFHVYVDRKGIEIRAATGEPVRAIYDGTVVYADWFKGYGLLIIVDHGEHYYSLYAHAARTLVKVGDRVAAGQVIGDVGETGLTQESRLYFEIRHEGDPVNPLAWLKRRARQDEQED